MKHFILCLSQGYKYVSDEAKENSGVLTFIRNKKLGMQSLQISSTFKFSIIFTLTSGNTLLITISINVLPMHL